LSMFMPSPCSQYPRFLCQCSCHRLASHEPLLISLSKFIALSRTPRAAQRRGRAACLLKTRDAAAELASIVTSCGVPKHTYITPAFPRAVSSSAVTTTELHLCCPSPIVLSLLHEMSHQERLWRYPKSRKHLLTFINDAPNLWMF
jgi:hypothetical protein